tara:strand:- start:13694 stop:13858 length:165 start_codon:yes stop_codon:yes gene_type:complete
MLGFLLGWFEGGWDGMGMEGMNWFWYWVSGIVFLLLYFCCCISVVVFLVLCFCS